MTTLPSSGQISLSNVAAVFGGTAPFFMSNYYAGGASGFVPAGTTGIPTSGEKRLSNFWGKSKSAGNGLYTFTSFTFTNASVTGANGPILSQCRSAYSSTAWTQDTTNNWLNMTTQGIQLWKVPATGSYTITCAGAAGGASTQGNSGGQGCIMQGTFNLTQSQTVSILVGQVGSTNSIGNAGGGGGSFVIYGGSPLIIGGGGGGATSFSGGLNGNSGTSGVSPTGGTSGTGTGGTNGSGASGGSGGSGQGNNGGGYSSDGSGGGGLISNAGSNLNGKGYNNGGQGGIAGGNTVGAFGGFGGGACGYANGTSFNVAGGGGGGGYSGGGGGPHPSGQGGGGGGSFGGSFFGTNSGHGYVTITPNFSITTTASTWEILLRWNGHKLSTKNDSALGSPGTATFMTMTASSTGANTRTTLGSAEGLYNAFFQKKNITKIAFVDGSGNSLEPTSHTNYLIYDLVESTGNESINDILKRLDIYQRDATLFHNNDTVWGTPSVLNHTAGVNGYSGLLSASGGTGFTTNAGVIPGRFCVMGINRDSDNDIQALCAFNGDLATGKSDSWRGDNPLQTFWSYWGHDFHSSSAVQRIGNARQTSPGVATGATWTGTVYMLAF